MSIGILDPAAMLDYATKNLRVEKLLIQVGLDPSNITYEAIFNRLLDIVLANITFANVLFLAGGIFLILTFVVRTIVPLRVLCIISGVFFLVAAALSGSVPQFFLYLLALPINFIRLFQIRNLVKKARSSARGDLSLDWLRPFMTARTYQKGDVLFHKGDAASEMFLTVTGKFLVTEIGVEIPAGRILGELGFVSPSNNRTQSVECIEDGEVLTVGYDRLREIYLDNPEFGYYFLRLTSDRLLQNFARLQGLVEESSTALAAAQAAKTANLPGSDQAGRADVGETKPAKAAVLAINKVRAIGAGTARRRKNSATAPSTGFADNVIAMVPKWRARLAEILRTSSSAAESAQDRSIAAAQAGNGNRGTPRQLFGNRRIHPAAHRQRCGDHGRHHADGEGVEQTLWRANRARARLCHRYRTDGRHHTVRFRQARDLDDRPLRAGVQPSRACGFFREPHRPMREALAGCSSTTSKARRRLSAIASR